MPAKLNMNISEIRFILRGRLLEFLKILNKKKE